MTDLILQLAQNTYLPVCLRLPRHASPQTGNHSEVGYLYGDLQVWHFAGCQARKVNGQQFENSSSHCVEAKEVALCSLLCMFQAR